MHRADQAMTATSADLSRYEALIIKCGRQLWKAAQEIERLRTENERLQREVELLQAELGPLHDCILHYAPEGFPILDYDNGSEMLAVLFEQLRSENTELRKEFAHIFAESVRLIEQAVRQLAYLQDENKQLRSDLAGTRMQATSRAGRTPK